MFALCATEDVIAEVVYTLRREKPSAPGHLTRRVHDVISENLDYRVENFESADDARYLGKDPNDEHVHAAAVSAGVDIVLTADKGFTTLTQDQRDSLPYEIYHPDEFFMLVDGSGPQCVRNVAKSQLDYWSSRYPCGGVNLVDVLERSNCPGFAERLRWHLQEI